MCQKRRDEIVRMIREALLPSQQTRREKQEEPPRPADEQEVPAVAE